MINWIEEYLYGDAAGGALDEIDDLLARLVIHVDPIDLDQSVTGQQTRVVVVLNQGAGLGKNHRSHLRDAARRPLDDHGAPQGEAEVVPRRRLPLDGELSGLGQLERHNLRELQLDPLLLEGDRRSPPREALRLADGRQAERRCREARVGRVRQGVRGRAGAGNDLNTTQVSITREIFIYRRRLIKSICAEFRKIP